jgi:hypothetical protein
VIAAVLAVPVALVALFAGLRAIQAMAPPHWSFRVTSHDLSVSRAHVR